MKPCKYCNREAKKLVVWLKDKYGKPAEIKLPYCGECDLTEALKRFWDNPYTVIDGVDYRIGKMKIKENT
jgi:hypothetical protein